MPAQTMLNASISADYASGLRRLEDHPGVERLAIGETGQATGQGTGHWGAPALFTTDAATFFADPELQSEIFGAVSLLVRLDDADQADQAMRLLEPQLTVSIHAEAADASAARALIGLGELKAGRIVLNDWPTGVEVCAAMVHGGPFPATTDGRSTSVGTLAIERFLRPVAYQNCPPHLLPEDLASL
jgi:NADP-dependent aldehyde dehydrogenase